MGYLVVVEPETGEETAEIHRVVVEKREVMAVLRGSAGVMVAEGGVDSVALDPERVLTVGVEAFALEASLPFSYIFPTFHATFSNLFQGVSFPFLTAWASQVLSDWGAWVHSIRGFHTWGTLVHPEEVEYRMLYRGL
jgi:hypothetical protein